MVEYTCRYTVLGYYWFSWLCKLTYVKLQLKMKVLALFSFTIYIIIVHRRLYVPNIVPSGFYPSNFPIESRS